MQSVRRPGQRDRAEAAGLRDAKEILEVGLLPKHRLVVGVVAGLLVATLQQRHAARTLGHHFGQLDPIGFVQGHRHPELRRVGARFEVRSRAGRQASLRPRVRPSCTSTVPSPRWKVGPSPWPSRHRRHSRSELASLSARLGMRCRRRGGPRIADARFSRAKESSVRSRPGMALSVMVSLGPGCARAKWCLSRALLQRLQRDGVKRTTRPQSYLILYQKEHRFARFKITRQLHA